MYLGTECTYLTRMFLFSSLKIDYVLDTFSFRQFVTFWSFCKTCWISALKMRLILIWATSSPPLLLGLRLKQCKLDLSYSPNSSNFCRLCMQQRSEKQYKNSLRKGVTFVKKLLLSTVSTSFPKYASWHFKRLKLICLRMHCLPHFIVSFLIYAFINFHQIKSISM